ncbi:MAG: hypothetical protein EYC70_08165 [Planctomycetota bacterium]|nr:MAG: hypothetical protein EYC70_08165 [Planctomycetota bacterium]
MSEYDPFARGGFPAGVRTIPAHDTARDRVFPCEIWYPAAPQHAGHDLAPGSQDSFTAPPGNASRSQAAVRDAAALPGDYPLSVFSHPSGSDRRAATFLCTHLCSHGHVVAALDHSEVVAPELARKTNEASEQTSARWQALIASRVPDIRFLLDHMLGGATLDFGIHVDPGRIGVVGHSLGGWTALAATEVDRRIRAVVALAPAGASIRKPGILPVTLGFHWGRDVPALYLVAENDTSLPLAGMHELFQRTPGTKRMMILRRADHAHFMDNTEEVHESFRTMPLAGDLAELQKEMRPIAELCSGEEAHLFARGLTLCHMDATLRRQEDAQRFLAGDLEASLAERGIDAIDHRT